jgi:hypothetical protein
LARYLWIGLRTPLKKGLTPRIAILGWGIALFAKCQSFFFNHGEVTERLIVPVSKTGVSERIPGVQIPPSPLVKQGCFHSLVFA